MELMIASLAFAQRISAGVCHALHRRHAFHAIATFTLS
jgi:hypothetical protein